MSLCNEVIQEISMSRFYIFYLHAYSKRGINSYLQYKICIKDGSTDIYKMIMTNKSLRINQV
jgi:hypothetical protein